MGGFDRITDAAAGGGYRYEARLEADGQQATVAAAWHAQYDIGKKWTDFKLSNKVGAFVNGGANFLTSIGIPLKLGISVIAVLVACFAATTLDSATRLQRYVVQELAGTLRIKPLQNKYVATGFAVILAGIVAAMPAAEGKPAGTGGLILWPLFGATNQLLAGLAFMVTMFYLWRRGRTVWFVAIPMTIMLMMPVTQTLLWEAMPCDGRTMAMAWSWKSGMPWKINTMHSLRLLSTIGMLVLRLTLFLSAQEKLTMTFSAKMRMVFSKFAVEIMEQLNGEG